MAEKRVILEKTEHACAILLGSLGVLVRGPSGSGKSRLCHLLIERFHQTDQFAQWICDDRVILEPFGQKTIAKCPKNIAGLAELRFGGVEPVLCHSKGVLDLVVDLVGCEALERMPEPKTISFGSDAAPIPFISVPFDNPELALDLIIDHVRKGRAGTE